MAVGGRFWADHFKRVAVPQVNILVEVLEKRILPSFAGVEQEAETRAEEVFNELGSMPASEAVDMGDLAESAQEEGLARYEALTAARQSIINAMAVALYHIVEQQLFVFHRKHVLHPSEEDDLRFVKLGVFIARLRAEGIDLENLQSWNTVQELRLVGNAAKHTDGGSASELRRVRPDLFSPPLLRNTRYARSAKHRRLFEPMAGKDLFVTEEDFTKYATACVGFFRALAEALR